MKRIFKGLLLGLLVLNLSCSCIKRDNMENIHIYTTVYPITYIINELYGQNSTIASIYPGGVDVNNYEFTDKQLNTYANSDLFIYNGLSSEKEIARKLINKNKKLRIIDVSYGLKIEYGSEDDASELWLSPNNYLMLATTVKDNLKDFITSTYIKEEIDNNYKKIQEDISLIDAELRSLGSTSANKNKNTLVVSSNMFKFLENYGFKVISLEDEKNITNELKNNFTNKTYQYIFVKDGKTNDTIDELVKNNNAKVISVNTLSTYTNEDNSKNESYINVLREFINNLSEVAL